MREKQPAIAVVPSARMLRRPLSAALRGGPHRIMLSLGLAQTSQEPRPKSGALLGKNGVQPAFAPQALTTSFAAPRASLVGARRNARPRCGPGTPHLGARVVRLSLPCACRALTLPPAQTRPRLRSQRGCSVGLSLPCACRALTLPPARSPAGLVRTAAAAATRLARSLGRARVARAW